MTLTEPCKHLRRISLSYNNDDSHASALRLILSLRPEWEQSSATIEFVRFTDGITNTLLKVVNRLPTLTQSQVERDAVLLRAYGKGTSVIIDRDRETVAHSLLSSHGLAPPLLARFENGLLYRFIEGSVCSPADLRRPMVWRGVAKRLGQWHATVPASSLSSGPTGNGHRVAQDAEQVSRETNGDTGGRMPATLTPNLWTVSQRWLQVLPSKTAAEKSRNANLQRELEWLARRLESARGVDGLQFVFSHCDLLHGNVIVLPDAKPARSASSSSSDSDGSAGSKSDHHRHRNLHRRRQHHHHQHPSCEVSFIDYEYCTPAPAAFDIANHFAEWGGFECDYSVLPTRLQRRDFLAHYLSSYNEHLGRSPGAVAAAAAAGTTAAEGAAEDEYERELDRLSEQVDAFRGVPGFYWGLWAHIQASISQIDFDYAGYAQIRLAEYWDWKAELLGEREAGGREMPLRERRWAQDE